MSTYSSVLCFCGKKKNKNESVSEIQILPEAHGLARPFRAEIFCNKQRKMHTTQQARRPFARGATDAILVSTYKRFGRQMTSVVIT